MSGPRYDWLLDEPAFLDEEPAPGADIEPEPEPRENPPTICRECGASYVPIVSPGWGLCGRCYTQEVEDL